MRKKLIFNFLLISTQILQFAHDFIETDEVREGELVFNRCVLVVGLVLIQNQHWVERWWVYEDQCAVRVGFSDGLVSSMGGASCPLCSCTYYSDILRTETVVLINRHN